MEYQFCEISFLKSLNVHFFLPVLLFCFDTFRSIIEFLVIITMKVLMKARLYQLQKAIKYTNNINFTISYVCSRFKKVKFSMTYTKLFYVCDVEHFLKVFYQDPTIFSEDRLRFIKYPLTRASEHNTVSFEKHPILI